MVWIFILEIPTGVVADYLGRKYSLVLGSLAVVFGSVIYGAIPSFQVFLLGEFLFALGMALTSGADTALIYDILSDEGKEVESKKVLGRAHSFSLLGVFVAALVGSQIAAVLGLNATMYLSAVPFLLAAIVIFSIREIPAKDSTSESKRYLTIAIKGYSYLKSHMQLKMLAIDATIVACAAYFVIWLYQPLLLSLQVPVAYFGWFNALLIGSEIVISSNFSRLEKIVGSGRRYLKITALIAALAFFTVALFPNVVTVTLLIILAGGFGLTRFELMTTYMNFHIPSAQRATILSAVSMFRRFGLVILNPLVGLTADYSLSLALFGVGLLPLLVFLLSPVSDKILKVPDGLDEVSPKLD